MSIGINTEAIVQGGRTFMSRNLPRVAKKEVYGLGRCNIGFNRLYKSFLITEVLNGDNSYTQEQIQCLESELLNEIQTQENLQGIHGVPATAFPPDVSIPSDLSGPPEGSGGATGGFSSCTVSVPSGSLVESTAGNVSILVTTNGVSFWTASKGGGRCTWITDISPSNGTGNGFAVVTYSANTTGSRRSCVVTFRCGSQTDTYTLTQKG